MLFGKFHQLRQSRHGTVFVHDFTNHAAFFQSCKFGQINRGFGVARSFQNTAFLRAQRKNMTGTHKIGWFGFFIHQRQNRFASVTCRNSCRNAVSQQIHRNRKSRFFRVAASRHHNIEPQFVAAFFRKWRTNQTSSVNGHKVDDFGGG